MSDTGWRAWGCRVERLLAGVVVEWFEVDTDADARYAARRLKDRDEVGVGRETREP